MKKELLPLGTLVSLSEFDYKVLIVGFRGIDDRKVIFDYIGLVYPYGFVDRKNVILFNSDSIKNIIYNGLKTQEDLDFKNKLYSIYYNMSGDK